MRLRRVIGSGLVVVAVAAGVGFGPNAVAAVPNLKAQLLALTDMPTGWSIDKTPSSSATTPKCFQNVKGVTKGSGRAEADFQDGADGSPLLQEDVIYTAAARSDMGVVLRVLNGCGHINFTSGGDKFSGTVGAMAFPKLGDQSFAFQLALSTKANNLNLTIGDDLVVIRAGSEIVLLQYLDLGTPDVTAIQGFARQAATKVKAKI